MYQTISNNVFMIINTNYIIEVQSTLVIGNAIVIFKYIAMKAMAKDKIKIEHSFVNQSCNHMFKEQTLLIIKEIMQRDTNRCN